MRELITSIKFITDLNKVTIGAGIAFVIYFLIGCKAFEEESKQANEVITSEKQAAVTKETVKNEYQKILDTQQEEKERLYLKNCSNCHGENAEGPPEPGHGVPPLPGPLLSLPAQYSKDEVKDIVIDGIPNTGMPDFGDVLSEEEITKIVDHLWTLNLSSENS